MDLVISTADAAWNGSLTAGTGRVMLTSSGTAALAYDWKSRSSDAVQTATPEELLAAALASCYSMALAHALALEGVADLAVTSNAKVSFEVGVGLTLIELTTRVRGTNLDTDRLSGFAEKVKADCPIGAALAVPVMLTTSVGS